VPVAGPAVHPGHRSQHRAAQRRDPPQHRARVELVDERDDSGGFLKTRLRRVRELCGEAADSFWTNQYGNPDGALGHYYLTAGEICTQVSELDYVFIGVSSGGTVAGISARLKERFPNIKVVAVDSVGSVIFGGPVGRRSIPGIGASIVPDLVRYACIDEVMLIPESSAVQGCRELLAKHSIFGG
jgi:N-(2-amino-2-carboxyethyl)-L-glutamate synthase